MKVLFLWRGEADDLWMNSLVEALLRGNEVCIKGPRPLLEQLTARLGPREGLSYIRKYSRGAAQWADCIFCSTPPPAALLESSRYIFQLDSGGEPHAPLGYDFLFTAAPALNEGPLCRSTLEVGSEPDAAAKLIAEVLDFCCERFFGVGRYPQPTQCTPGRWREELEGEISRRELFIMRRVAATETCIAPCREMDPELDWSDYYTQQETLCRLSLSGKTGRPMRSYRELRRTVSQFKSRYYLRLCDKTDARAMSYRYACMYALRRNKELLEEYAASEEPHESLCCYCADIYMALGQNVFAAECDSRYLRASLSRGEPLLHTDAQSDRRDALRRLIPVMAQRENDESGERLELARAYLSYIAAMPQERLITLKNAAALEECLRADGHEEEADAFADLLRAWDPEYGENPGDEPDGDAGDEDGAEEDAEDDAEENVDRRSQEDIADSGEQKEQDEEWDLSQSGEGYEEDSGEDGEAARETADYTASDAPPGAVTMVLPKKKKAKKAGPEPGGIKRLLLKLSKSKAAGFCRKVKKLLADMFKVVRHGVVKRLRRCGNWWKGLFSRMGRYLKKQFPSLKKIARSLTHTKDDLRRLLGIYSEPERDVLSFRDIHRGRSCFIIGNGPSLRAEDLEKISAAGYVCFASNKIYKIYGITDWRPDYYACIDDDVFNQNLQEILSEIECPKFLHKRMKKAVARYNRVMSDSANDIHYCSYRWRNPPRFYPQVANTLSGGSVTFTLIELAWMMGFRDMYIIGCDHFYNAFTNIRDGQQKLSSDSSTSNDYFIKNYMKPGEIMRVGNLDRLTGGYVIARNYVERHGGRIRNATRGGYLEVFERVDLDALLAGAQSQTPEN